MLRTATVAPVSKLRAASFLVSVAITMAAEAQSIGAFCPNPPITHSGNLTVNLTQSGAAVGGTGTADGIRDSCNGSGNQTFWGSVTGQLDASRSPARSTSATRTSSSTR